MGSSGGSQPKVITPGESAQAATGTAGAGEMMSIANQPIEQYANLATMSALGPAETQAQQALQNQAAYQSAAAQQDMQSRVDPQAYAQRQMRMQAATQRLGQLYGQDPTAFTYRDQGAYSVPGTSSVPSLADLGAMGSAIARNVYTASVDKKGTNPQLRNPQNPQTPVSTPSGSYMFA